MIKVNEETIEFRLDQIEKKLDAVTDLLLQTNSQELRLTAVENEVKELKGKKEKTTFLWLTPLVSATISGIIALIIGRL